MTTWKHGGRRGEISNEDNEFVCIVQTVRMDKIKAEPWPEGEANFALILKAPEMLEALEAIAALDPDFWCEIQEEGIVAVCNQCKEIARAAIAAAKGEDSDDIG